MFLRKIDSKIKIIMLIFMFMLVVIVARVMYIELFQYDKLYSLANDY